MKKLSKLTFEQKITLLRNIESKANSLALRASIRNKYHEMYENYNSHFNIKKREWDKLMLDLRGWAENFDKYDIVDDKYVSHTKQEWIKFCEKTGLFVDYSFEDVLA